MENRDMNLFDFILFCCRSFVRMMKWLGVWSLRSVRLGLQYFWIVVPCVVLGVLGGWLWTKQFMTKFEGKATIMYAEGMREVVSGGIIDFMNMPLSEKMEYGLSEDWLDALGRVDIYNVIDCNADSIADFVDRGNDVDLGDTLNVVMRDRVQLSVQLFGRRDFELLESALTKFFSEQEYAVEADKRCKLILKDRLAYLTREVARLDSFSTYDYFVKPRYLGVEKGNYIISERKQELYYDDLLAVLKNRDYVENQVLATPNVINFQTPFVLHAMPPVFKYFIGLVCGGVLGLLLALAVKYWAVVVAYLKEK